MTSDLRVIVAQMGARRNYAIPRMLHQHGALSRLYTDSCATGMVARIAAAWPRGFDNPLIDKLRRRTVSGIPASMIYSCSKANLLSSRPYSKSRYSAYEIEGRIFGRQMMDWGIGNSNVLYAMFASGLPFLSYAGDEGLKVVVDMFLSPLQDQVVLREQQAYSDWEDPEDFLPSDRDLLESLTRRTLEVADLLLCPSSKVLNDTLTFCELQGIKCPDATVLPYGATPILGRRATPIPGRVLFAGAASLGKGIQYFARAAGLLSSTHPAYEFLVAGRVTERIRNHPQCKYIKFLGFLSREKLDEEYRSADVFVLPTLSEGSAGVIYEALAFGVPVVTTASAGSVITNGVEGYIVPERDPVALAAAIERIVRERSLRAAMAKAAMATAREHNEEAWGRRLIAALSAVNA